MAFQVSPGVNVSEIDLTTVVPAVSTTEGALAGHFRWGPADQRILVSSEDQLVNIFNKPNSNTATDFFTAANFLAYGNALYVVRTVNSANANNASTGNNAILIKNEESYNNTTIGANVGTFIAKYPGELGNSLKVSACFNANGFEQTFSTDTIVTDANVSYTFTAGSKNVTIEMYGANSAQTSIATSGSFNVGDIILSSNNIVLGKIKSITSNTQIVLEDNYRAFTDGGSSNLVIGSASNTGVQSTIKRRWEYADLTDTAPRTTAYANSVNSQGDALHVVVVDAGGAITGTPGQVLEVYKDVSLASDARTETGATNYYKEVINQQSPWIWWANHNGSATNAGKAANKNGDTGTIYGGPDTPITNRMSGGVDGPTPTAAQKITGYDLFKSAEDVDISFLLGGAADTTLATHLITNIAEYRKDCIVVLSPEREDVVNNNAYSGKERDDIIAFRNGLPSSSYAVMDSGWKYQYDKYNDIYRYVPLNADTAGLMVQTDITRDPWYSPAGFNRGNVKNAIKLAYNPNKSDRDQLYKAGVNPVVTFPGQGTVLFGDKTLLAQPSAFDRINVRRLFIVLEKAISTAAKFTLFEFNDEFTRSQFKNLVEPFLRDVQGRRGVTDFAVVCDSTNNTGEVIDRNEFIGDIYIKPARSINFIQLNFVAVRTGVEFSEIVGRTG